MSLHTRSNCAANKLSLIWKFKIASGVAQVILKWSFLAENDSNPHKQQNKGGGGKSCQLEGKESCVERVRGYPSIHPLKPHRATNLWTAGRVVVAAAAAALSKEAVEAEEAGLLALSLSCEHLVRDKVENKRIEKMNIHRNHTNLSILSA